MRQILGFLFAVLLFVTPLAYAQDYNPMYDFYKGLADVIERNMTNPGGCVSESEVFIKENIGTLQASIEQAQKMAAEQPAGSEEGAATVAETMSDSQKADMAKGMEALDRFMQVFNSFAQSSPEEAEKIAGFISQYAPQPPEMEPGQAEQYEEIQEQGGEIEPPQVEQYEPIQEQGGAPPGGLQ